MLGARRPFPATSGPHYGTETLVESPLPTMVNVPAEATGVYAYEPQPVGEALVEPDWRGIIAPRRDAMTRTPEVEQVLRIVRQVVRKRFPTDKEWVLIASPLLDAIVAAVDAAGPAEP